MNELLNRINSLRLKGFSPNMIVDIGANEGEWTNRVRQVFPHVNYFLIDGNPYVSGLLQNVANAHENITYVQSLLSESEKTENFYLPKNNPFCTGASMLREKTAHYSDANAASLQIKTETLDCVLRRHGVENVDMLKLDVQGAELMVLRGGLNTLQKVDYCLLEVQFQEWNTGAPFADDIVGFMTNQGFGLYDVFDRSFVDDFLVSADFLFQNKKVKVEHKF